MRVFSKSAINSHRNYAHIAGTFVRRCVFICVLVANPALLACEERIQL